MANNKEAQTNSSNQTSKAHPQANTVSAEINSIKQTQGPRFHTPLVPTTLAVIALLFALYALYSSKEAQNLSIGKNQDLQGSFATIKQQQSDTRATFNIIKESMAQLQITLQNQMQDLDKKLQTAMQQNLYKKQDWLLLKARYLLELAQINAHWSGDQQSTVALLQQADALLVNLSNQQLFAVRQAIAKEISQLQALPKRDISGLLSQLDAAQIALTNLPSKQPLNSAIANHAIQEETGTVPPWKERLKESLNILEKLVIIRHNDEDIQPLLSPLHQTLWTDSVHLNLQEAQWAILQTNAEVYHLSLAHAIQGIQKAFDENSTATQALLKQLQNLQQEQLDKQSIRIDESYQLLNQVIENKNIKIQDTSTTPQGGKAS